MSQPPDLSYLLDYVPADVRAECARALEVGRARGEGRELIGATMARGAAQARPATRTPIPVHPEVAPQWYREEVERLARGDRKAANRQERRALAVAVQIANGATDEAKRAAYRQRQRAHQRTYHRKFHFLKQPAAPDGLGLGRASTAEQFAAARSALADEWGCRAAVAAMPAGIARALLAWVRELGPSHLYGSPWSSRLVRRTVSTLCVILYVSRPAWRDGYALATTGFGRDRIAGIMGPAPESGRCYSVGSLSHCDFGSLAILERIGVLRRTQLPGDAVPACDRGNAYAFNHYLVPLGMVDASDQWGQPSRVNPSLPPELAVEIAPWMEATDAARVKLDQVRAVAMSRALRRLVEAQGCTPREAGELDPPELDELDELDERGAYEHPPPNA